MGMGVGWSNPVSEAHGKGGKGGKCTRPAGGVSAAPSGTSLSACWAVSPRPRTPLARGRALGWLLSARFVRNGGHRLCEGLEDLGSCRG